MFQPPKALTEIGLDIFNYPPWKYQEEVGMKRWSSPVLRFDIREKEIELDIGHVPVWHPTFPRFPSPTSFSKFLSYRPDATLSSSSSLSDLSDLEELVEYSRKDAEELNVQQNVEYEPRIDAQTVAMLPAGDVDLSQFTPQKPRWFALVTENDIDSASGGFRNDGYCQFSAIPPSDPRYDRNLLRSILQSSYIFDSENNIVRKKEVLRSKRVASLSNRCK
jgi:hypothetical protein